MENYRVLENRQYFDKDDAMKRRRELYDSYKINSLIHESDAPYRIQIGYFTNLKDAESMVEKLRKPPLEIATIIEKVTL